MWDRIADIGAAIWWTAAEMSPYLLLGFLVAGLLSVFVSAVWVERHLGGRGLGAPVKAAVFGVPLPLCSCGVIPLAASLRQHGASKGATASFLIATPQTGVDSIFATYALLGPLFAVVRPVVALVSGVVGGVAVQLTDRAAPQGVALPVLGETKGDAANGKDKCSTDGSCCGPKAADEPTWGAKVVAGLKYAVVTLPNDIAKPLILGIVVAGVIAALAEPGTLAPWLGGGLLAYLVMTAVGVPMYVCSTGSIPLGLSFIHLGASPGAALAFLIAGPATNAATIAVNWRMLGRVQTFVYMGTVVASAVGAAYLVDALVAALGQTYIPQEHMGHVHEMSGSGHVWAALLVALVATAMIVARLPKRRDPAQSIATEESNMADDTKTLEVKGMTCSHCAAAVTRALRESPGVTRADVELASGRATVTGPAVDVGALVRKVEELGYSAKPA